MGWRDWPGDIGGRALPPGCELSPLGGRHVPVTGDIGVPPLFIKEKKENKEYATESREAVHNVPAVENNNRRCVDGAEL